MLLVGTAMLPLGIVSWAYREHIFEVVTGLNLPGGLVQLPEVIFTGTLQIWKPEGIDFRLWRGITWPLFCTVFWCLAGRAIEALVALKYHQVTPKIGWVETIVGFLVMAAGATIMYGMLFGLSSSERNWKLTRIAAAGGLWALLGSLSIVARFRQSKLRKRLSAAA
jgi:hypothetical protein